MKLRNVLTNIGLRIARLGGDNQYVIRSYDDWVNLNGVLAKRVATFGGMNEFDTAAPSFIDSYGKVSAVYKASTVVANAIAAATLKIYDYTGDDVSDMEVFRPLYYPNTIMTQNDFWRGHSISKDLTGKAFWKIVYDDSGKLQFYLLRPDNVQIIPDKNEFIKGYKYWVNNRQVEYSPEEVIYFRTYNPKAEYDGLSVISAVQDDIVLNVNSIIYNRQFFKNSASPSGFVEAVEPMSQAAFDRLKQQFTTDYTNPGNAGKVVILEGAKFHESTILPRDMQYLESRKFTKNEIGAMFGVPPVKMSNYHEASLLANAEFQVRMFWEDAIIPRLSDMEMAINQWVIPLLLGVNLPVDRQYYCGFELPFVPEMELLKNVILDRYQKAFMMGAATPDEIRVNAMNLDPIDTPETQSVYLPFSLIAVGETKPELPKAVKGKIEQKAALRLTGGYSEKQLKSIASIMARFRAPRERSLRKKLKSLFEQQETEVLKRLNELWTGKSVDGYIELKDLTAEQLFELEKWKKVFEKALEPELAAIMLSAAELAIAGWELGTAVTISDPQIIVALGNRMREFSQIQRTTIDAISSQLKEGWANQETLKDIAARIESVFTDAKGARAMTIATTETTYAQNTGMHTAMEKAGVETKTWQSSRDSAVRDAHQEQNIAQLTVKVTENFLVGGEHLPYPASGSLPENNINCRCVAIPGTPQD